MAQCPPVKGYTMTIEKVKELVEAMHERAIRVYKADRASGADAVSVAFDAGRVDALKEIMEMIGGKA